MSVSLVALGIASLGLAAVHVFAGGKQCARPLLAADIERIAKLTLYACWHYVSLHLLVGGLALLWIGLDPTPLGCGVAAALAVSWLAIAAVFLALIPKAKVRGAWFQLGQWMAFVPMGGLGLWAALG